MMSKEEVEKTVNELRKEWARRGIEKLFTEKDEKAFRAGLQAPRCNAAKADWHRELTDRSPHFASVLEEMGKIHLAKSHDYATETNPFSNFEHVAQAVGVPVNTVFAVMIQIKMARLKELLGVGKTPKHESIADTLVDLANYSALWAAFTKREFLGTQINQESCEKSLYHDNTMNPGLLRR